MRFLKQWFTRWGNEVLREEVAECGEELAKLKSTVRIQQLEIDELTAMAARNQKRWEAETADAAHRIAKAESEKV